MGHQGTIVEHWKRILKTCAKGTKSRVYNNTCHEGLHGAHKSSQDTWHVPSPVPWRVPQGLAWCPRAESRHVTHATARAMMLTTRPCMCPWAEPRHVMCATSCATTTTMTLDMVLEVVLGHVPHAMMHATTSMPWCHAPRHDMCRMPPPVPRHL